MHRHRKPHGFFSRALFRCNPRQDRLISVLLPCFCTLLLYLSGRIERSRYNWLFKIRTTSLLLRSMTLVLCSNNVVLDDEIQYVKTSYAWSNTVRLLTVLLWQTENHGLHWATDTAWGKFASFQADSHADSLARRRASEMNNAAGMKHQNYRNYLALSSREVLGCQIRGSVNDPSRGKRGKREN